MASKRGEIKWSDDDISKMIRCRMEKDHLFSGKRFSAAAGWEVVLREIGLNEMLTPARAAKKWENLKKTYKELQRPPSGSGTESGEPGGRAIPFLSQAPHIQSQIDLMESQGQRRRNQGQHNASASGAIESWSCWRGPRKGQQERNPGRRHL
ncbi:hypothetical protein D4764_01G0015720 [Takifugu flavidus]|uniref:Myb/SANT-like DNA-binding domain-containing protein n=1 Tax=Takifugu flavidus TaxID=433684 RepID=A0A5C6PTJ6_9TELE|nr:hypothetical protein D4764_01G0015720 [Takifugu flavidus]